MVVKHDIGEAGTTDDAEPGLQTFPSWSAETTAVGGSHSESGSRQDHETSSSAEKGFEWSHPISDRRSAAVERDSPAPAGALTNHL